MKSATATSIPVCFIELELSTATTNDDFSISIILCSIAGFIKIKNKEKIAIKRKKASK